jgi:hypothetical protein
MKRLNRRRRLAGIALVLALLASLGLASASGMAVVDQELLLNGNFESGFTMVPGCGMVGTGWGCFTNGGTADYGFYDDQWPPVVGDGEHSQLIEINTMQYAASEADRYAGIYQTVSLVPGRQYQFRVLAGMRERDPDPLEDPFRYRVQWGYTWNGSTDWQQVTNWMELPFDKIDERTAPTGLQSYSTSFMAPGPNMTLFVRAWKKWGTAYKELDVNIDSLSLWGPGVRQPVGPAGPVAILPGPALAGCDSTLPASCGGANLINNGSFEGGFALVPGCGAVGSAWGCFTNGGSAGYGFYDEQWMPVVKDGGHSQLIEINTKQFAASEADRFAGIYQVVRGLKKGATYDFSVWGAMREEAPHPDEDMYRYRVEWGYAPLDANPSPADITNWVELPWDTIYPRIEPGPMEFYSVSLQAPSNKVILALRAWKKWGTSYRELDVNLDAIQLVRCNHLPMQDVHTVAPGGCCVGPEPPQPPGPPGPPLKCAKYHVVVRGDTLYALAKEFNTTVAGLADLNHIANPNLIYVGQKLCVDRNDR